jgi:hypothetical protein
MYNTRPIRGICELQPAKIWTEWAWEAGSTAEVREYPRAIVDFAGAGLCSVEDTTNILG